MSSKVDIGQKTVSDFIRVFSCSYAMAGNLARVMDMAHDDLLSSSVIGFGSGLATMGDTCGAMNAAIAVLGARYPDMPFPEFCSLCHSYYSELERRAGAADCGRIHGGKHLAGNFRRAILMGKTRACTKVVRAGAEILVEYSSWKEGSSEHAGGDEFRERQIPNGPGVKRIAQYFEQESFHCCASTIRQIAGKLHVPAADLAGPGRGFCGGIGFNGTMCGAIAGGVLSLGLLARLDLGSAGLRNTIRIVLHGLLKSEGIFRDEKHFPPARLYAQCREVYQAVEQGYGAPHCREILGLRLDKEEDQDRFIREGMLDRCRSISRTVAETVAGLA